MKRFLLLFLFIPFVGYSSSFNRIVSLSPPITEEIYLLGLGDRIIANTVYCLRPKEAQKKEKVGTVLTLKTERIIALRPDLVFASPFSDRKALEKIKKMGIKVVIFPHPRNFEEVCERFLKVGHLLGKEKEAEKIVNEAKKRMEEIKNRYGKTQRPTVFFEIGSKPLFTATKDSIVHSFLDYVGGKNIAEDAKTGLFSKEEVIRKDPDFIFIVTMGIEGEREKRAWMNFKELKAVKRGNIYLFDSYKLCSPTPVSYVEASLELAEILHGKKRR